MKPMFIVALLACGCGGAGPYQYEQVESSRFRSGYDVMKLTTVQHNGHLFVVATESGHGLALIHSPACKCQSRDVQQKGDE